MLCTLAVSGYRSLRELVVPLLRLNLVTGPNGSGKSNLYRALRLLAETAQGRSSPHWLAKEACIQPSGPDLSASGEPSFAAIILLKARCEKSR
jgi:AAA15 family ATPase/GTPase